MLEGKQLDYFLKSAAITHAAAMYEAANTADRAETEEKVSFAAGVQSTIEDLEEALALGTGHDPEGHSRTAFLEYSQQIQIGLNKFAEKCPEAFDNKRTADIAGVIAERVLGWPQFGSPFHLEGLVS